MMEIMKEYREKFMGQDEELHGICKIINDWLPEAVKREIKKAVKEFDRRYRNGENYFRVKDNILQRYKPAFSHCSGMKKAIDEGNVVWLSLDGKYLISRGEKFNRCPFCPDGENCIG
jgi:hypothetical protein